MSSNQFNVALWSWAIEIYIEIYFFQTGVYKDAENRAKLEN